VSYRKQGRVVRWENGTVVRVTESGVAVEEGELFRCWPDRTDRTDRTDETETSDQSYLSYSSYLSYQIAQATANVTVERLLLTHGHAHHQYGDRSWSDETRRLHLSLVKGTMRVLIDQADFDITGITRIATALGRAEAERDAPPRLRLAPNVTAALLPALVGVAPPNVKITQTAGGIDGNGNDIVEADTNWPNWYRPSYRVRPVKAPLNLRIECGVTAIEEDRPIAIALLAPVHGTILRVLVEDRDRVYPATVRVTRIDAVAAGRRFYPYGAGSFGAEMML
jgi:hypothetical protein